MFVFQAKCEAGQQPSFDAVTGLSTGECEPCPMDTYKTDDVSSWKDTCTPCGEGLETVKSGSTSAEQCMGEFIFI